jgi:hypothetical protein
MLEFVLQDHLLSVADTTDKVARPVNIRVRTDADMAEALAKRNIGISKPEALAALAAIGEITQEWVGNGEAYNGSLTHIHFSIPGVFRDSETPNKVAIRITPSKALTTAVEGIRLKKVEPSATILITEVRDSKTGEANSHITRGGNIIVMGHNIKIVGENEGVGLWFVPQDSAHPTLQVPAQDIVVNDPSRLIVVVPTALVSQTTYYLKAATLYCGSGARPLKEQRVFTFEKGLVTD